MEGFGVEVIVDRFDHRRGELFRGEAVATADDFDVFVLQHADHVEVERLAGCARLFGAVENGNFIAAFRKRLNEVFRGERTVQTDFDQAEFFALSVQLADGLLDGVAGGTHGDDDFFSIRCSDVVEQVVLTTDLGGNFIHVFLNDFRNGIVEFVNGFAALEVNIRVLRGNLEHRSIRAKAAGAEGFDRFRFEELFHNRVVHIFHLLHFVRGAESVEEVQERHGGLQSGQV